MKLYTYFRSGTAFRARIALNLKGLEYEPVFINLANGEQRSESYLKINPMGGVPTLEDKGKIIPQSLAIIEYLEDAYPQNPLLPKDALGKARVRSIAHTIAMEIHPLHNLRTQKQLEALGLSQEQRDAWCCHWIAQGFDAIEKRLNSEPETGIFCHGECPTIADIFLVSQMTSAPRWGFNLSPYKTLNRIFEACMKLDAFQKAAPSAQPDAPKA